MAKVGEDIVRLTKEYCGIYDRLKADGFENAGAIAVSDLILKRHTYEEALKNVEDYIKQEEAKASTTVTEINVKDESAFERTARWYEEAGIPDPLKRAEEQGLVKTVHLCPNCKVVEIDPDNLHPCPSAEDAGDDEFLCTCCEDCEDNCAKETLDR